MSTTFGSLFKKYRLLAGYDSVSSFATELANRGYPFEDSIIYKWQTGQRIPKERQLILTIIKIFVDRKVISSEEGAQEILKSINQSELTQEELSSFSLNAFSIPFQAPKEIKCFIGRDEIIKSILQDDLSSKVILLQGASGMGKTVLAIKLAHILRSEYSDGVLWCKVESGSEDDLLYSFLKTFGEGATSMKSLQAKSIMLKNLLQNKKILIILDGVENSYDIDLFTPTTGDSTLIVTSKANNIGEGKNLTSYELSCFSEEEVGKYFKTLIGKEYNKEHANIYQSFGRKVGNLPLALSIIGAYLLKIIHSQKLEVIDYENVLKELSAKNTNLFAAIKNNFNLLDKKLKTILVSAMVFGSGEFSSESIAYLNGITAEDASNSLREILKTSLIDESGNNKYRIHSEINKQLQNVLNNPISKYIAPSIALLFAFLLPISIVDSTLGMRNIYYEFATYISNIVMCFVGIWLGLRTARKWGGYKYYIGKVALLLSFGLVSLTIGNVFNLAYLAVRGKPPIYPFVSDIFFFITIPFYISAVWYMIISCGKTITFRKVVKFYPIFTLPLLVLILPYAILFQKIRPEWVDPARLFLDILFPFGDALYVAVVVVMFVIFVKILDGVMRKSAFLLMSAFVIQFISDLLLRYTSSSYANPLNIVSYFIMALSLLSLSSLRIDSLKE